VSAGPETVGTAPRYLLVGEIRKPHGIKGELFVAPTTDHVDAVYAPGAELLLADPDGRPLDVERPLVVVQARPFKKGLIVRLDGVEDRNAAEVLRGRTFAVSAEDVPPLEDEEYFLHDLTDLEVQDVDGERVGRVQDVYTIGAAHLLGVHDGERERLVPFNRTVVREVDIDAGRIVIEPIPGLLDV
jgi:16S rRNA processing protein RimM